LYPLLENNLRTYIPWSKKITVQKENFTKTGLVYWAILIGCLSVYLGGQKANRTTIAPALISAGQLGQIGQAALSADSLKGSGWFSQAVGQLRQRTYDIKKNETDQGWYATNIAQRLLFNYHPGGFAVTPHNFVALQSKSEMPNAMAKPQWLLQMEVIGLSKGGSVQKNGQLLASSIKDNMALMDYHDLRITYTNDEKGMRQDFTIKQKPVGHQRLRAHLRFATDLQMAVSPEGIVFSQSTAEVVMRYNALKVWDANGTALAASFVQVDEQVVAIEVNDEGASYPITIDPLSSSANTVLDDANQASAFFGYSVASAGDVNGDGYSDVIIGAYFYDIAVLNDNRGAAFVYHGSATGLSTTPASFLDDVTQNNASFAQTVSTAGDVNGDGYGDVIVGAPQFTDGSSANEGRAYLYYGSAAGLGSSPGMVLDGANAASNLFGYSVACAGDVNNDGYSDLIISAFLRTNNFASEGAMFIYHGSAAGISNTPAAVRDDGDQTFSGYGTSVSSAGDVNGDGYSDVVVGSWSYDDGPNGNEGRAWVYYGGATGIAATPSVVLNPLNVADAYFGNSVSCAGDVNGDGYSDVIVGAYGMTNGSNAGEGLAYLFYGSAAGLSTTPATVLDDCGQAGAQFGRGVACAGDINGDGYSDVVVSAPSYDEGGFNNEGQTFVYYGSAAGLSATPISQQDGGAETNMLFGIDIASAGDVNGDGFSDIVIGASQYDGSHTNEGRAWVYHGSPGGLAFNAGATFTHDNQANAQRGHVVSSAGDVNADGYADALVSARFFDDGFTDEGVVYVYHGSATGLPTTPTAVLDDCNQATAYFGHAVSAAGDVNGDGYGDVVVGAYLYDNGNTNEGAAFVYHGSATGLGSSPVIRLEVNYTNAHFGISVASAGDVNADGYSDLVIGASGYGEPNFPAEGRAFYYYGSASGVPGTPSTYTDRAQPAANYGNAVAGAGDVNGDGYSDVIIGEFGYDSLVANDSYGRAYMYFGSALGISNVPSQVLDDALVANGLFGSSVSAAGDINGDGYSDVVVGAFTSTSISFTAEGYVYVYYGSATGLGSTQDLLLIDGGSNSAAFGFSVGSAGDVNGDGYSDVVVGTRAYDGSVADEGAAMIYYGSPTGLPNGPNLILQNGDQALARFGFSVGSAGDVNGDGYSDVMVGAPLFDAPGPVVTDAGRAWLYYGGNGRGIRNNLRLYNSDLVTPIQQSNLFDPNLFGLGLFQQSPLGRQSAKLVWERVGNSAPFSGNPIANSVSFTAKQFAFTDLGIGGTELKSQVAKAVPVRYTAVRGRVEYSKAKAITGQVYGPWRYPDYFLRGRRDLGAVVLPVRFVSFTAVQQNDGAQLRWLTTSEQPGVSFEVQHSTDGINFVTVATVAAKLLTSNTYTFLHPGPLTGRRYYRIKAVFNQQAAYTEVRRLDFKDAAAFAFYPNPIATGQTLYLQSMGLAMVRAELVLTNEQGQTMMRQRVVLGGGSPLPVRLPALAAGVYTFAILGDQRLLHSQQVVGWGKGGEQRERIAA
jgi:hypothetical protein